MSARRLNESTSIGDSSQQDRPEYFNSMFAGSDDPWKYRVCWYERGKRAFTLACFLKLVEGTALSVDDVLSKVYNKDWYFSANQARHIGLIGGMV